MSQKCLSVVHLKRTITKQAIFHYLQVISGMLVNTYFQTISNVKWRHIFIILFGNSFWRNMRLRNITSYIGTWAEHNIWPWKYAFKIYSQLWRKFFRVMVSCLNSDYYIDGYVCVTWFGYKLNRRQGKGNVRFVSIFPIKLPLNDKLYDDDRILPSRIKMIL